MGYMTIKSLIAVPATRATTVPTGTVMRVFTDGLVRSTRSSTGVEMQGPNFLITADTTFGGAAWGRITLSASTTLTADECERINRFTRGTKFPRVETNWRIKSGNPICVNLPGRRVPVPFLVSADLDASRGEVIDSTLVVGSPTAAVVPPTVAAVGTVLAASALAPSPSPEVTGEVGTARAALSGHVATATKGRRAVSPVKPEPVATPLKAAKSSPVGDPSGVFTWPTKATGIIVPKGTDHDLDLTWRLHAAGDRQVICLIGPAGVGKTSLAYDLAVRNKVPVAKIDGAGAVTFADWVGSTGATERNGATVTAFRPSGFLQAVRADGPMAGIPRIVLLDEVNRAESAAANNALIPVLDHTGSLYVADAGRSIPLDPSVMFVMTANMGGEFTGTVQLDAALTDRVTHWVEMLYPTKAAEVKLVVDRTGLDPTVAAVLVDCATQIRATAARGEIVSGIGPRRVLMAARKIVGGFGHRAALYSTWSLAYSSEGSPTSERDNVRSSIDAFFKS
jgi:hypothetical protein